MVVVPNYSVVVPNYSVAKKNRKSSAEKKSSTEKKSSAENRMSQQISDNDFKISWVLILHVMYK